MLYTLPRDQAIRDGFPAANGVGCLAEAPSDQGFGRVCAGFDSQKWYQALFDYGTGTAAVPVEAGDADEDLVPRLVPSLLGSSVLQQIVRRVLCLMRQLPV